MDEGCRRLQRYPRLGSDGPHPGRQPPATSPMSITIAGTTFEHHHYDQRGDVLYLSVEHYEGSPTRALSTPEGHNIEYDETGRVVGMTLTNVAWLLDRDGEVAGDGFGADTGGACRQPRADRALLADRSGDTGPPGA